MLSASCKELGVLVIHPECHLRTEDECPGDEFELEISLQRTYERTASPGIMASALIVVCSTEAFFASCSAEITALLRD